MDRLYFAYGSNMNPVQMLMRCPYSKAVARATISGYRLAINSRGVATIVRAEKSSVSGVLWKISRIEESFLDCFEGVASGAYVKRYIPVSFKGRKTKALVYVDVNSDSGVPRAGYLEKIIRGAEYFNLDRDYISKLERLAYA